MARHLFSIIFSLFYWQPLNQYSNRHILNKLELIVTVEKKHLRPKPVVVLGLIKVTAQTQQSNVSLLSLWTYCQIKLNFMFKCLFDKLGSESNIPLSHLALPFMNAVFLAPSGPSNANVCGRIRNSPRTVNQLVKNWIKDNDVLLVGI